MRINKLQLYHGLTTINKIQVLGLENITHQQPTIFISNHNCLKDIFYQSLALPVPIVSLISARLIYKPDKDRQEVVQKFLYSMPIEAHGGSIYANMCLEVATDLLCNKLNLGIFPEGAYIDDKEHVYRGRTGAARILFAARDRGIDVSLIPVAIDINQDNNDLDNFNLYSGDKIIIRVLEPISYASDYDHYCHSNNRTEQNQSLHNVIDIGMQEIAKSLNREYINEYIELWPKGDVIFQDGTRVPVEEAQHKIYLKRYRQELAERTKQIIKSS